MLQATTSYSAHGLNVEVCPSGHAGLPAELLAAAGISSTDEVSLHVEGHGRIVIETSQATHERMARDYLSIYDPSRRRPRTQETYMPSKPTHRTETDLT